MLSLAQRVNRIKAEEPAKPTALNAMVDKTPFVKEVLEGVVDADGKQVVKPGTLGFWLDGNRLKFVIRLNSGNLCGWGVCKDPLQPFDSIELANAKDEIDWKEGKISQAELPH